jgi:NADH:ubiquinone oxidoreductase subunit 6 (subunit J)
VEAINWHSFFFLLFALVTCAFAVAVVVASNVVRMAFYLIVSLGATSGLFFLAGADFVAAMQLLIYVGGTVVLLVFGVMLTAQSTFVSMKTHSGEWILGLIAGGALLAVLLQTAFSVDDWRADERLARAVAMIDGAESGERALIVRAKQPGPQWAGVSVKLDPQATHAVSYDADAKELVFQAKVGETTAQQVVDALSADHEAGEWFAASVAAGVSPDTVLRIKGAAKTQFVGPSTPHTATALGLGLLGPRVDKLDQKNETLREGMSGYLLPFEIVSMHLLVVLIGAAYLARTKKRAVPRVDR